MPGAVELIVLAVLLLPIIAFAILFFGYLRHWTRARLAGVPISLVDLVGMRFRRIDPKTVIDSLILARHSGLGITSAEMQVAYLQGVDLEKVTLAAIEADRRGLPVTFRELVDAELANRLDQKLRQID